MANLEKSIALRISWLMLLVLGVLLALGGAESLYTAYHSSFESLAGMSTQDLARTSPEILSAIRGRRATAASLSLACGVMIIFIALFPYRRGEK